MYYISKGWIVLLLSYLFIAGACEDAVEPGPSPEDFTKEKRERLGDILHQTILNSSREFSIPRRPYPLCFFAARWLFLYLQ